MKIFQRFFKVTHEEQTRRTIPTNKKTCVTVEKTESKDLVQFKRSKRFDESEVEYKDLDSFTISLNGEAYFYNTLNLERLRSFDKRSWAKPLIVKRESFEELGMGYKADLNVHVGNKVLPICDSTISSSIIRNEECGQSEKKDKRKTEKNRAISRMKEMLRWAAASKSEKRGNLISRKGLNFRNRSAIKAAPQDDELSLSSPKISFRWDVGSCSTSSSAYSAFTSSSINARDSIKPSSSSVTSDCETKERDQCRSRTGNWITTDTEYVVLEL